MYFLLHFMYLKKNVVHLYMNTMMCLYHMYSLVHTESKTLLQIDGLLHKKLKCICN